MDAQLSFASLDFAGKKKRTKRDVLLAEMAAVVPWSKLEALIEPHYPKVGPHGGRRPFPIAVMLRIYCLQQWYNLSDPGAEEALYDIQSMRAFCHLELGRDPIPDETFMIPNESNRADRGSVVAQVKLAYFQPTRRFGGPRAQHVDERWLPNCMRPREKGPGAGDPAANVDYRYRGVAKASWRSFLFCPESAMSPDFRAKLLIEAKLSKLGG